jgi:hypothetical protein
MFEIMLNIIGTVSQDILLQVNKIFKTFLIEDFFHLPPVSLTPVRGGAP